VRFQFEEQARSKVHNLTDNVEPGHAFRDAYLTALRRMLRKGTLKVGGRVALRCHHTGGSSRWNLRAMILISGQ